MIHIHGGFARALQDLGFLGIELDAEANGGIPTLTALAAVFSMVSFMPTGGITAGTGTLARRTVGRWRTDGRRTADGFVPATFPFCV